MIAHSLKRVKIQLPDWQRLITFFAPLLVLILAVFLGSRPSIYWLGLPLIVAGFLILISRPVWGLPVLIAAALLVPRQIDTGTDVPINFVTILVPAVATIWLLYMVRQGKVYLVSSTLNKPLFLFLLSGLISLGIGIVTWDTAVPKPNHFSLVQIAQWSIFALSAIALWMVGNLIINEKWLKWLTFFFLLLAGSLAIVRVLPGGQSIVGHITTIALHRAPFWYLTTALAAGQLLFNKTLNIPWKFFLLGVVCAALTYAFVILDERVSNWASIVTALAVLFILRFPRAGKILIAAGLILLISGAILPFLYDFAGGDAKWFESGGARLVLIERTLEVTMRNPITGLGPAAYRYYAATTPLIYEHIIWYHPLVASHNNYVDLISHVGLLGTGLFLWFMVEIARLGWRLRSHYREGFASGYVNGMLAAWAATMVVMLLADWFLPFVYNIRFSGFQASILVWIFLGGLVALEQLAKQKELTAVTPDG